MSVTIKDIAAACGLSVTTVSLVLNNKPNRIPEETRNRITSAAESLNYHPNRIAVSMITKRTDTIGLILPDINNLYFSELAKSLEEEVCKHGYTVLYGNTADQIQREFNYVDNFLSRGVDALIIVHSSSFGIKEQEKVIGMAKNADTPLLSVDRSFEFPEIPCVMVDQYKGGYTAATHLIRSGHRKIGCITGPSHISSSLERLKGYEQALKDNNIPFDEKMIYTGDFQAESGYTGIKELLKQGITAVFACNDMMALGVYKACAELLLSIPDDLSVIGFDDIFITEFINPPLTTLCQPVREIGREVARQTLDILSGNVSIGKQTVFVPILKNRSSTKNIDQED